VGGGHQLETNKAEPCRTDDGVLKHPGLTVDGTGQRRGNRRRSSSKASLGVGHQLETNKAE
jgi:hypothetical protein